MVLAAVRTCPPAVAGHSRQVTAEVSDAADVFCVWRRIDGPPPPSKTGGVWGSIFEPPSLPALPIRRKKYPAQAVTPCPARAWSEGGLLTVSTPPRGGWSRAEPLVHQVTAGGVGRTSTNRPPHQLPSLVGWTPDRMVEHPPMVQASRAGSRLGAKEHRRQRLRRWRRRVVSLQPSATPDAWRLMP